MLVRLLTETTLAFDMFGDIEIENEDLKVRKGISSIIQIISDYLKTNLNDYNFYTGYGANYDKFIGKAISQELVDEIIDKVSTDIYKLGLLQRDEYIVVGKRNGENSIQMRIIIHEDDSTIFMELDSIGGISIG